MLAFARPLVSTLSQTVMAALLAAALLSPERALGDAAVMIAGRSYVNHGLVGAGRIPADLRDRFGETFGSGSGLAVDPGSWQRTADGYEGIFYMLPDRGYNIGGTFDYRARLNKLAITFKPVGETAALPPESAQQSVVATLTDTIALTDNAGAPLTGLDPTGVRPAANGFPESAAGIERPGQHRYRSAGAVVRRQFLHR